MGFNSGFKGLTSFHVNDCYSYCPHKVSDLSHFPAVPSISLRSVKKSRFFPFFVHSAIRKRLFHNIARCYFPARALPNVCVVLCIFCVICIFVLFYVLFVLCRSLYCLCVYVY